MMRRRPAGVCRLSASMRAPMPPRNRRTARRRAPGTSAAASRSRAARWARVSRAESGPALLMGAGAFAAAAPPGLGRAGLLQPHGADLVLGDARLGVVDGVGE